MKKALLFFIVIFSFILTCFGRIQPVSLDLVQPSVKEVEIKGEVKKPGVYQVKWDANMQDVIDHAGGLKETADTSSLSLARIVDPREVIVIPIRKDEQEQKISINTASLEQLQTLPGIGPKMAERIIEYRSQTSFSSLEQLKEVKGIGDKTFERLQEFICL